MLCFTVYHRAAGMLPMWSIFYEKLIYADAGHIRIPFVDIFVNFAYMSAAVLVGDALRRRLPRVYFKFWLCLPSFTLLTVAATLAVEIYTHHFLFRFVDVGAFFLTALLAAAGYASGAVVAYLARQPSAAVLDVAVETGVRTTRLVGQLLVASLPVADGHAAQTTPALYAVLTLLPVVVVATGYRVVFKYRLMLYAETECKMIVGGPDDEGVDDLEVLCAGDGDGAGRTETMAAHETPM